MHPNDGRVVSNFIMQAIRGEDITIYGDGNQTRSFCYVDDLLEAMTRTMNTPDDFTGPVNIGNPVEFSMLQLAQAVIRPDELEEQADIPPSAVRRPQQRRPDISLANKVLDGWEPDDSTGRRIEQNDRIFRQSL